MDGFRSRSASGSRKVLISSYYSVARRWREIKVAVCMFVLW